MARSTSWRTMHIALAVAALVLPVLVVATAADAAGPGTPYAWGSNQYGQLGDGSFSNHRTPAPVNNLTDVIDMHGGRNHVIALRENGTVRTWGRNNFGQLGVSGGNRNTPVAVSGLTNIVAVETGHYHSLALRANGTVMAWGFNGFGQLGDGTTTSRNAPVQVSGLNDVVAIAAGRNMSYAVRSNGQVWGWGLNSDGQLGDGTRTNRRTPVRVGSLTNIETIAGGRDHGLAVQADGDVFAWGDNRYGQVGDGTTTDRINPVRVETGAAEVIAGAHHSYALLENGRVMSWGRGYRGQLGNGSTATRRTPVQVSGITNAVAIGSGRDHGLAVMGNGSLRTWGFNDAGQLGDGTTQTRTTPVTISGISDAELAGAGRDYSVVLVGSGAPPPPPPPNEDPTARISSNCSDLFCSFSGAASSDPDGTIASYAWTFGDGGSANGVAPSHSYGAAGTYTVRLTVTDNDGATDSAATQVTVSTGGGGGGDVAFRAASQSNGNTITSNLRVPGSVQGGDQLVLIVTINKAVNFNTPNGWTLLGTEQDGSSDMRSWLLTRTAPNGYGGNNVAVTTTDRAKKSAVLLAYSGADPITAFAGANEPGRSTTHDTPSIGGVPADSFVVSYWSDKSGGSSWTAPGSVTLRVTSSGSGGGQINAIAGDTGPVGGSWPGRTATSTNNGNKAIMWTVVVAPS